MIGRSGGEKNPEITVAAICSAVTIYSISFIVSIVLWPLFEMKGKELFLVFYLNSKNGRTVEVFWYKFNGVFFLTP